MGGPLALLAGFLFVRFVCELPGIGFVRVGFVATLVVAVCCKDLPRNIFLFWFSVFKNEVTGDDCASQQQNQHHLIELEPVVVPVVVPGLVAPVASLAPALPVPVALEVGVCVVVCDAGS